MPPVTGVSPRTTQQTQRTQDTQGTQQTQQTQQPQQTQSPPAPQAEAPVAERQAPSARQSADARARATATSTTQSRLSSSYVPAPSLDQVRSNNARIGRGHQGESVVDVQRRLNAAGANPRLEEDGKFGPRTQAAVQQYQESRGITDTGVVGQTTLQAMDQNRPAQPRPAADNNRPANNGGNETRRTNGTTSVDTSRMSEAQKYEHYRGLIEQNGGRFRTGPNERNILSMRNETNTRANGGGGAYDDRTVMLWRDRQGNPRVTEYRSNTEPSSRYEGRMGEDVNRDGRLDLGRMRPGYYEYRTGSSSSLGRVLRPTQNMTVDRDTNHDGRFTEGARGNAGQSMLFHAGGNSITGSAGCQTMSPAEYNRFWRDLNNGGNPGTIGYTLINAN